jgi:lipopolysaccharide/colanic/teichoic acid biosynthesis glycosyltransferase
MMSLRGIASWLSIVDRKRGAGRTVADDLEGLRSAAQMARLLQQERARTDRTGEGFSLLVLTPAASGSPHSALLSLAALLRRRLRSTDEVGWMDDRRLGALLPATPPHGAHQLADELVTLASHAGHPVICQMYYYPSDPVQFTAETTAEAAPRGDARSEPMLQLFVRPLPVWKRALDLLGAITGLVVLAPLLAVTALAIRATSPGPVFFRQWRSGRGGRPFRMYKFRSMVADAEAKRPLLEHLNEQDGPAFKIQADPRVTRLGRFLRRTNIDELPQLWNVLRGEMSLVGPRPLPCNETAGCDSWQLQRLDVTPGLTCIWQVEGHCRVAFAEWMRMDLRYIRARSLRQDLALLLGTVAAVLRSARSARNSVRQVPTPRLASPGAGFLPAGGQEVATCKST